MDKQDFFHALENPFTTEKDEDEDEDLEEANSRPVVYTRHITFVEDTCGAEGCREPEYDFVGYTTYVIPFSWDCSGRSRLLICRRLEKNQPNIGSMYTVKA